MESYLELLEQYRPGCDQEAADKALMLDCCRRWGRDILTRDCALAHITSSGFVLDPGRSQVLMAWHNIYNTWAWTGGHADGDPDMLGVALREAAEETGVIGLRPLSPLPLSLDVLTVDGHRKRGQWVSSHLHLNYSFVLIAPVEGQQLAVRPQENSRVGWLPIHRLGELCNEPEIVAVYEKLIARAGAFPNP